WRADQKAMAVELGYKPLEASRPGSGMHAEGEMEVFRQSVDGKVTQWAISRGRGGNSVVCNEGCKNLTRNWGPQQK
ncbi:MAG: hypothetical protein ABW169_04720, partial [Sphingobium sp.]